SVCLFFITSRRRHTISKRDWSSDVCSSDLEMYLLPSSLEQLKRSGRVSTPQAIFASLLNINLLLRFQNGKVIVEERIRNKRRAKRRLFNVLETAIEKHQLREMSIMHAGGK